jgi:hypothetical protein
MPEKEAFRPLGLEEFDPRRALPGIAPRSRALVKKTGA